MRPAVVGELVHGVIGQGYIGVAVFFGFRHRVASQKKTGMR